MHRITPYAPLTEADARQLLDRIAGFGVTIEPGLTEAEIAAAERRWGFRFAPEHRTLLAVGQPADSEEDNWPDWRDLDSGRISELMEWQARGVESQVDRSNFWHPSWGSRPDDPAVALALAREHTAVLPILVPVDGWRFLPEAAHGTGNPVLSFFGPGTDVLAVGRDLAHYFTGPGDEDLPNPVHATAADVPFWTTCGRIGRWEEGADGHPPNPGPHAIATLFARSTS
ncbi:hypothetical protein [Streptomyces fractus]|uniref:hypothetical protein n=1 Tax=Streptomyces fractus TaxID=641806 RepID=UPI003CF699D8